MLNHLKTGSHRYKLANRTLYFSLTNLSKLNLKSNSTWEKNAHNFLRLPSKGSGRLTFKGLTMTGATTCNGRYAAGAWPWVLLVVDIFKPVFKGSRN